MLNLSIGGTGTSDVLWDAVRYADANDVPSVAAMGNSNNAARLWGELTAALFGEAFPPVQWVKESFGL